MSAPAKPVPQATAETEAYWEGCRGGELRLQCCSDCGHVQFPPRRFCSRCLAALPPFERASGRGRVRSFSVVRHPISSAFADEVPFVVALIELAEGPTMMAGIRGCAIEEVAIGMPVEVEFEERSEAIHLPYFHPIRES